MHNEVQIENLVHINFISTMHKRIFSCKYASSNTSFRNFTAQLSKWETMQRLHAMLLGQRAYCDYDEQATSHYQPISPCLVANNGTHAVCLQ